MSNSFDNTVFFSSNVDNFIFKLFISLSSSVVFNLFIWFNAELWLLSSLIQSKHWSLNLHSYNFFSSLAFSYFILNSFLSFFIISNLFKSNVIFLFLFTSTFYNFVISSNLFLIDSVNFFWLPKEISIFSNCVWRMILLVILSF